MLAFNLNGDWRMRRDGGDWLPARVPGSVYADLMNAGAMDDPFYRDNEDAALEIMRSDFEYEREFDVSGDIMSREKVMLKFDGLDTLSDVYVNGAFAGHADNMHRTWLFDVKGLLREGKNTLIVKFLSPTKFIENAWRDCPIDGSTDAMLGFPHLRKAHCMFGWDWGPRLPDAGIWRDASLIGYDYARLLGVKIGQIHGTDRVTVKLTPEIEWASSPREALFIATVTCPDGREITSDSGYIVIENPELWWPNGMGARPLYRVETSLIVNGTEVDRWDARIGLRTLEVRRENDKWGQTFEYRVNGVSIFAMGGDYIPEDNILSRVTPERTRRLIEDCALANHNCIRVWGGGYYPDDFFYDICDEAGLIVWQDFMFSCAMYELTPEFAENVKNEIADNVRRVRHHACLGLWCANNELEWQVADRVYKATPKQNADYIRLFEYLIPSELKKYDDSTSFWPSSPSSGGGFDYPNDPSRGDCHYWDVWHNDKPFTEYRKFFFRFASEFGFQSFPCLRTIESFTLPGDRNIFSYVMERHQRNRSANGKIMNYMSATFRYPKDFDSLVYASQLLQAEAIRYGVEHWRRNRGRCMGAVYWQVNDCWPVASWSSIDYFGRWKALHYASKRFFAPILLSCREEGELSQETNVNAQGRVIVPGARLAITNDTAADADCEVKWSLRSANGDVLTEGSQAVVAGAMSAVWLDELPIDAANAYGDYLWYELYVSGVWVSSGSALFCAPKHFNFRDPNLTARVSGDRVIVKAEAYARSVEITTEADALFEDNFFDMNAGVREIKILRGKPGNVGARSVWDISPAP